jgi:murein L,D-transpeptidase YcbB/YkuD
MMKSVTVNPTWNVPPAMAVRLDLLDKFRFDGEKDGTGEVML